MNINSRYIRSGTVFSTFGLAVIVMVFILPFLVAVNTAFKPGLEVWNVVSLPSKFYFNNFIVGMLRIGRGFINSIMIVIPAMALAVLVGSMAAYPLSQLKFKGDDIVYMVLTGGLYIPHTTILIPLFLIIRKLGLYDTIPGLWLVHVAYGLPFTTLMLRNFFAVVPCELLEAATIDGCGLFGFYWRILLPTARTGIATCLILQFRHIWNEFLFGLTLTRSEGSLPVTIYLQKFESLTDQMWGPLMAAVIITIIPVIIVLFVFKRQFIRGMTGVYK